MRIFWWWFNCFSNKIFIFYSNFFYEEADLSHDFLDIDSLVDPSYIDIVLSCDASGDDVSNGSSCDSKDDSFYVSEFSTLIFSSSLIN